MITPANFDEEIEWTWFYLWHHEGRRARHGAAMRGVHNAVRSRKGPDASQEEVVSAAEAAWLEQLQANGMTFESLSCGSVLGKLFLAMHAT